MTYKIIKDYYSTEYFYNGLLHREDAPAVEWYTNSKEWWVNGRYHRLDGPAIERCDGDNFWYINGVHLTKEITEWFEETEFNPDYKNWTTQEQFEFKLRWS